MGELVLELINHGTMLPTSGRPREVISLRHLPPDTVRFVAMPSSRVGCGLRVIDCLKLNSSPIGIQADGTDSSTALHRPLERTPCLRESADAGEQLFDDAIARMPAREFARLWHSELDKLEANVTRLNRSFAALFGMWGWP